MSNISSFSKRCHFAQIAEFREAGADTAKPENQV